MRKQLRGLIFSAVTLLLCVSMLIGTTYAWFTDSVTSGTNRIVAGSLDVELQHMVAGDYVRVGETDKLFNADLWEPGVMVYETFKVTNEGSLALKYLLSMSISNVNYVAGTELSLLDVLKVAVVEGEIDPDDREAAKANDFKSFMDFGGRDGKLLPKGTEEAKEGFEEFAADDTFTVILYWEPTENDNDYNLRNGVLASDGTDALNIDLTVYLVATQVPYEADSFDESYDADVSFPRLATGPKVSAKVSEALSNLGVSSYHTVKSITFADYDESFGAWESGTPVGSTKADDIRIFVQNNGADIYFCVQPGQKIMLSGDCTNMFWNFVQLETVDFGPEGLVSTENVTNMSGMFKACKSLTSLDLSGWDVSNVTSFRQMFTGCSSLAELNLSGWEVTSNATAFSDVFNGCASLTELDLSGWDLSKVNSSGVSGMFNGCSSLEKIYANDWTAYGYLIVRSSNTFLGCEKLQGYDEANVSGAFAKPIEDGGYFSAK